MRVAVFGQGPAYEALVRELNMRDEYDVVFSTSGRKSPDYLRRFEADIFVSCCYAHIFTKEHLEIPELGVINTHNSLLPKYRGRCSLNWALINGETEFGMTVHYVDEGIDTGSIILQQVVPIKPEDDYSTLQPQEELLRVGLTLQALRLIRTGTVIVEPQRGVPTYCGPRQQGDEVIDWNWTSERIHNFVRALTPPGPGALTHLNNQPVRILKTWLPPDCPSYIGIPGQVIGKNVVKTGDGYIYLSEVETDAKLRMGSRLVTGIWKPA